MRIPLIFELIMQRLNRSHRQTAGLKRNALKQFTHQFLFLIQLLKLLLNKTGMLPPAFFSIALSAQLKHEKNQKKRNDLDCNQSQYEKKGQIPGDLIISNDMIRKQIHPRSLKYH